jgi:hypothetical protein
VYLHCAAAYKAAGSKDQFAVVEEAEPAQRVSWLLAPLRKD